MYKKRRSGELERVSFQSQSESIFGRNLSSKKRSTKANDLQHQPLLLALLNKTSQESHASITHR